MHVRRVVVIVLDVLVAVRVGMLAHERRLVRVQVVPVVVAVRVVVLGPVPGWVAAHEGALRATVVVAAAGTVVLWNRPTGRVVLVITVVALVAIGLVQLLAAPARRARVAPSGPE